MSDLVWEEEGKRFNKRKVAEAKTEKQVIEICADSAGGISTLKNNLAWAKQELKRLGFDVTMQIPLFKGAYYESDDHSKNKSLESKGELIKKDSVPDFLTQLWWHCSIALNENNPVEVRLKASFAAGDIFRVICVYSDYGPEQSDKAKKPRKANLKDIYKILNQKYQGGSKPRDLWDEFEGLLSNSDHFENVQEHKPNPANNKSWYYEFDEIKDKKVEHTQTKYETFSRTLRKKQAR